MTAVTAIVSIGNSDNKLTQLEWHDYVAWVDELVEKYKQHSYFRGFSPGDAAWQNAAWWFTMDEEHEAQLKSDFRWLLPKYKQESIALVLGNTELIKEQK